MSDVQQGCRAGRIQKGLVVLALALYEGVEDAVLADLVTANVVTQADSDLLTQAQADALAAQGEDDLWGTINRNADTNTAVQTALAAMRQACRTMEETLRGAGITGAGNGGMSAGGGAAGGPNGESRGDNEGNGNAQGDPSQGAPFGKGGRNGK